MFCKYCGKETVDGKCPSCDSVRTPKYDPDEFAPKHDVKGAKALGIICLACGIAGLAGYGAIAAIVSLIMGALYVNRVGKPNDMVKIGRVLAIVSIALNVLVFMIAILLVAAYCGIGFMAMLGSVLYL